MGGIPLRRDKTPDAVRYGLTLDVQDPDAIQARINGPELSLRLGDTCWYLPKTPHLALELLDRLTDQTDLLRDHLNTRQVQQAETFAARETNERFAGLNREPAGTPGAQPIRIVPTIAAGDGAIPPMRDLVPGHVSDLTAEEAADDTCGGAA